MASARNARKSTMENIPSNFKDFEYLQSMFIRTLHPKKPGSSSAAGYLFLWLLVCAFVFFRCTQDNGTSNPSGGGDEDTEMLQEVETDDESSSESLYTTENGFIRDASGRAIVLRGIAYPAKDVSYWSEKDPAEAKNDLVFIAESGFNAIRLVINWDRIEPEPNEIDEEYCDLVTNIADWAAEAGLYIVVDMHQDMFGMGFGLHGAPYWACDEKYYETFEPAETWFFSYFSDEVKACFDGFWNDEELQRHQQNAAAAIASRLVHNERVLGFDTFNEPFPGSCDIGDFGRDALWPFHERFHEIVSEALPGRILFFEPAVVFSATLDSSIPGPKGRFSGVFSPHYYNSTVELDLLWDEDPTIDSQVVSRVAELSKTMDVPWMLGEIGGDMRTPNLKEYLISLYSIIDASMGNAIIWIYSKSDKGFALIDKTTDTWTIHSPGYLRVAPSAIAGEPESFSWNPTTLTFEMMWKEDPSCGESEILIPDWAKKAGFDVTLDDNPADLAFNSLGRLVIPAKATASDRTMNIQVKTGTSER